MDVVNFFNPLHYVSSEKYAEFWGYLFHTIFCGFWARLFAVVFLVMGLWLAVRRQRLGPAVLFYLLSFIITYGGGIYRFFQKLLSLL